MLAPRVHGTLTWSSDYIGGTFFNYVHTLPLLKKKPSSAVCSVNARNHLSLPTIRAMDAEYACLGSPTDTAAIFNARAEPLRSFQHDTLKGCNVSTASYHAFQRVKPAKGMTRSQLEHWMCAFFFKLALPINRPIGAQNVDQVHAPLNLTAFFRVLRMLHGNGYPSHWLAETLVAILENRVKTSARPPRTFPLQPEETGQSFKLSWVDIAPFTLEMRTLTAMWMCELPFGIPINMILPPVNGLRRYTIHIPNIMHSYGPIQFQLFSLLFCPLQSFQEVVFGIFRDGSVYKWDVRKCLLSDEKRDAHQYATNLRKTCAVVSTWTWNTATEEASFWMDEEMMRTKKDTWYVSLLRTDSWLCVAEQQPLTKARAGERWATSNAHQV